MKTSPNNNEGGSHRYGVLKFILRAIALFAGLWFVSHWSTYIVKSHTEGSTQHTDTRSSKPLPPLNSVQAAANQASNGAVVATSVFPGPDGLVGAVVHAAKDTEQKNIIWFTRDLKAVVVNGHLVSAEGADLTKEARYVHGLLLRPRDALTKASAPSSRPVMIGKSGPILTAFFDPNCIYCHMLYAKLAPLAEAGQVRLRMVLVGVIKPSSAPRAASILAAVDPVAAMTKNETDFDVKKERGGMPIADPGTDTDKSSALSMAVAAVKANTKLFEHAGASGTPALLFCSRRDRRVHLMPGLPSDVKALVDDAAPASECHS